MADPFFDADDDPDGDHLTNAQEHQGSLATDPSKADTDGDTFTDGQEVEGKSNPKDPKSVPVLGLSVFVSSIDLEFQALTGRRYQIRRSNNPSGPWQNLGDPITGDGTIYRTTVPIRNTDYRFFNIQDITN